MLKYITQSQITKPATWRGRFAPTPSGELHFGSLVAALGSYLIAKSNNGEWLVRIEDLDPPRVVAGATKSILATLQAFGFEWDGEVVYQSQRDEFYQQALNVLSLRSLTYACDCSRKQIELRNHGIYDAHCKKRNDEPNIPYAIRTIFDDKFCQFEDHILGHCHFNHSGDKQDFIVKRRDGLFAYQLAVVVDDIEQGIDHVVRGADILDSTPRQNFLYDALGYQPPQYFHLPLSVDQQGEKLSKHKLSPAIEKDKANVYLLQALQHLGQKIDHYQQSELAALSSTALLKWATQNWSTENVGRDPIQLDD